MARLVICDWNVIGISFHFAMKLIKLQLLVIGKNIQLLPITLESVINYTQLLLFFLNTSFLLVTISKYEINIHSVK